MRNLITSLALTLLFAPALFAQMPPGHEHMGEMGDMKDCKAMMQQHDAMQKHMAEMDAKLQALVDDMNKAKGSAKTEKMAAVINELVAQRAMMQKHMTEMMPMMMSHMAEHMKMGMMKGMSDSMMSCPMMQGEKKEAPMQH
jgi:hypothetical protein